MPLILNSLIPLTDLSLYYCESLPFNSVTLTGLVVGLIKKYWDCYVKVGEAYKQGKDEIIELTIKDETPERRQLLVENYEENFNEPGLIVQNLLARDDETLAEDVETLIGFSLREGFDLQSLNIGEITMLLIAVIEVNMDFFEQNLEKLSLLKRKPVVAKALKAGE